MSVVRSSPASRRIALRRGHAASFIALIALGCGGTSPRSALALRESMRARGLDAAHASAPDLVAETFAALDEAEASERASDAVAAADHRARAALLGETALTEAERASLADVRRDEERAEVAAEDEAVRLESEAATDRAEASRLAGARAAREELRRALSRAATEEASGRRSRRLSLDDARELRLAATAIRNRTALLLAAATALGATEDASAPALAALALSLAAGESDPLAALTHADEAHDAARLALGAARRARGEPTAGEARSLAEAADAEGLGVVVLERGVALELENVFASGASTVGASGRALLGRVASLLSGFAAGPVRVEIELAGGSDRVIRARGEAVVAALGGAGLDASRLTRADVPSSLGDRVRLVLPAYSIAAALSASAPTEAAEPGSAASLPADPTPSD